MTAARVDENFFDYKQCDTLVIEGCGVRFISYIKALEVLDKDRKLAQVRRIAASSSGCIVSFMLAIGYAPNEIEHMLDKVDFSDLLDPSTKSKVPVVGTVLAMTLDHGVCPGDKMIKFIQDCLVQKGFSPDITFAELHASGRCKDLYLTAMNVSRGGQLQIFSHEATPHVLLAPALLAAMAYPGLIRPVSILIGDHVEKFFDGGARDNFPIEVFPAQEWTRVLGLRVDTREEIFGFHYRTPGIGELLLDLVHDGCAADQRHHRKRTLQIYDGGFSSLQVKLSPLQKLALQFSGGLAAEEFVRSQEMVLHPAVSPAPALVIDPELQKRTSQFLEKIQKGESYSALLQELQAWKNSEPYIHYHLAMTALRERVSRLGNGTAYYELLALLKSRAIKVSCTARATPEQITAITLDFLKDNQVIEAHEYLKQIYTSEFFANLHHIDHEIILRVFRAGHFSVSKEGRESFESFVELLQDRQLKNHPGAKEANYVVKVDKLLQAGQYDKAFNLLMRAGCYLPSELEKIFYQTMQQQLQAHATQESLRLLTYLQTQTDKKDPVVIHRSSSRVENILGIGLGAAVALLCATRAKPLYAFLAGALALGVVKLGCYVAHQRPRKPMSLFDKPKPAASSVQVERSHVVLRR